MIVSLLHFPKKWCLNCAFVCHPFSQPASQPDTRNADSLPAWNIPLIGACLHANAKLWPECLTGLNSGEFTSESNNFAIKACWIVWDSMNSFVILFKFNIWEQDEWMNVTVPSKIAPACFRWRRGFSEPILLVLSVVFISYAPCVELVWLSFLLSARARRPIPCHACLHRQYSVPKIFYRMGIERKIVTRKCIHVQEVQ